MFFFSEMISNRRLLQLPRPQQYPYSAADPSNAPSIAVVDSAYVHPATAIAIFTFVIAIFLLGFFSLLLRFFNRAILSDSGPSAVPESPNKGGGLDSAAVESLPLVAYSGDGECAVCLSEFEDKEIVKLIPYCGHVFHPTCIDTWLKCHVICPLCRSAQLFKSVVDGECSGMVKGQSGFIAPPESMVVMIEPLRTWGPDGVRRICSCSDLDHRTAPLKRSSSF